MKIKFVTIALYHTQWHTHTHTHCPYDSFGRGIGPSQRTLPGNTQHSHQRDIHVPGEIRTRTLSKRAALNPSLRPRNSYTLNGENCVERCLKAFTEGALDVCYHNIQQELLSNPRNALGLCYFVNWNSLKLEVRWRTQFMMNALCSLLLSFSRQQHFVICIY